MGANPDILWSVLEGDDQIPAFLDAVATLYRDVLDRLPAEDRPFFFDYWLRTFNLAATHLATVDGLPHALVTQPFRPGTHEFRWETATLACSEELDGRLVLPQGVDTEQSFRMSAIGAAGRRSSPLLGLHGRENQRGYARSLTDCSFEAEADAPWTVRRVRRGDFEEAIDLLRRSEISDEDPDPDLSESTEELRQTIKNDAGWCWVASRCRCIELVRHRLLRGDAPSGCRCSCGVDFRHRRRSGSPETGPCAVHAAPGICLSCATSVCVGSSVASNLKTMLHVVRRNVLGEHSGSAACDFSGTADAERSEVVA